jgi:hypothetical protein
MRPVDAPKQRAASTYSSWRTTSARARTSRASCGEKTTPTAIMPLVSPMPSAPVTAIASTIDGERQQRVDAAADAVVDPAAEVAGEQPHRQAERDRDADRQRAGVQRRRSAVHHAAEDVAARSSVPSRCAPDGSASALLRSCTVGEYGASHGGAIASSPSSSRKPRLRAAHRSPAQPAKQGRDHHLMRGSSTV